MALEHPPFIDVFFHLNLHLVRRCTATLAAKRERRASHRIGVWFFIFFFHQGEFKLPKRASPVNSLNLRLDEVLVFGASAFFGFVESGRWFRVISNHSRVMSYVPKHLWDFLVIPNWTHCGSSQHTLSGNLTIAPENGWSFHMKHVN